MLQIVVRTTVHRDRYARRVTFLLIGGGRFAKLGNDSTEGRWAAAIQIELWLLVAIPGNLSNVMLINSFSLLQCMASRKNLC